MGNLLQYRSWFQSARSGTNETAEAPTDISDAQFFSVLTRAHQEMLNLFPVKGGTTIATRTWTSTASALARLWQQTAITASITNGSPTVTLSATPLAIETDEFGVVTSSDRDGGLPLRWYTISDVTANVLTLDANIDEATNSTAVFITAQVPLLDSTFSSQNLSDAMVFYALHLFAEQSLPDGLAPFLQKHHDSKNRFLRSEDDATDPNKVDHVARLDITLTPFSRSNT